jgi:hypothetical protein
VREKRKEKTIVQKGKMKEIDQVALQALDLNLRKESLLRSEAERDWRISGLE